MTRIEQPCLVVIDVQERLAAVMADRQSLIKNVAIAVQAARLLDVPVIWLQQCPQSLGPTVDQVSQHLGGLEPINKDCFSAWQVEQFRDCLQDRGSRQVLLCGIEAHICVYQTAVDLVRHGFEVHVLADAISSRSVENRQLAIMRMCHEAVKISSAEMAIFELLGSAADPRFRQVSRLIK